MIQESMISWGLMLVVYCPRIPYLWKGFLRTEICLPAQHTTNCFAPNSPPSQLQWLYLVDRGPYDWWWFWKRLKLVLPRKSAFHARISDSKLPPKTPRLIHQVFFLSEKLSSCYIYIHNASGIWTSPLAKTPGFFRTWQTFDFKS